MISQNSININYYDKIALIESKLSESKGGLRILIDRSGLQNLNNDPDTSKLRKLSIICVYPGSDASDKGQLQADFEAVKLDELASITQLQNYIEVNWKLTPGEGLLYMTVSEYDLKGLISQNEAKVTVLPFPIQHESLKATSNSGQFHELYENGGDPKTGINYLKVLNRVLCRKLPIDKSDREPIITQLGYQHQVKFNLSKKFYKPNNFRTLEKKLIERSKIILTGYGMGNDYAALKLLQSISHIKNEKKIYEVRSYSRDQLPTFVQDFDAENLHGASVILRDFFDPFLKTFNEDGTYDFEGSVFIKLVKEYNKDANNAERALKNPKRIPATKILNSMTADQALERIFRDERIFDFFDGKSGNYLIITSQFDSDERIAAFYQRILKDHEIGRQMITAFGDKFFVQGLDYSKDPNTAKSFFNELFAEFAYRVDYSVEKGEKDDIEELFKSFLKFTPNSADKPEPFRVALAVLFRDVILKKIDGLLAKREFVNEVKDEFFTGFKNDIRALKTACDYYYKFLH